MEFCTYINENIYIMKGNSLCTSEQEDAQYFADSKDKFEMVSCPIKEKYCKNYLSEINNKYRESEVYRENREYQNSVAALKNAFYKSTELKETPCNKCAEFFQTNIIQSVEGINQEIHKMTVGWFKSNRYNLSYIYGRDVSNELKKAADSFKELKKKRA